MFEKKQAPMKMRRPFLFAATLALTLCGLIVVPAIAAKKEFKPPDGVKVASTAQIAIYVVKKDSKPWVVKGSMLNRFEATILVHKTESKLGRQRSMQGASSIDGDLLDPSMWQVGDYDADGLNDYRFVAEVSKGGCRTWKTWLWLPDQKRFTFGAKIHHQTDASGKPIKVCR